MKLIINDHRKIFAIQEEFHKLFPNLKIEFLAKPSKSGAAASEKLVHHGSKTIGECRTTHNKGELTLTPTMTVADVKESFSEAYGLSTIILKKEGEKWVETIENGKLQLEEQNK
jgi:hypothetical protein